MRPPATCVPARIRDRRRVPSVGDGSTRAAEGGTPVSVIEASTQRFTADPTAAKSTPAVTAVLDGGRAHLSAGSFTWECDLAPAIGGQNLAPSPTVYLLGALAGCAVTFISDTLAPQLGLRVD